VGEKRHQHCGETSPWARGVPEEPDDNIVCSVLIEKKRKIMTRQRWFWKKKRSQGDVAEQRGEKSMASPPKKDSICTVRSQKRRKPDLAMPGGGKRKAFCSLNKKRT